MRFYTDLTFAQFLILFIFLGPAVNKLSFWNRDVKDTERTPNKKRGPNRKLSPQNQLLLTLMRLRVGLLLHQDLAYRFCISLSMVSDNVIT